MTVEIPYDPWMAACNIEGQTPLAAGASFVAYPRIDGVSLPNVALADVVCTTPTPVLTMDSYQQQALSTAVYPREAAVVYPVLGMLGEAGEVAEKVLKAVFPDGCPTSDTEVGLFLKQVYVALLDAANAGAVCEATKKVVRDKKGTLPAGALAALKGRVDAVTPEQRQGIVMEVGDCPWYIAAAASDLGYTLGAVGQMNLNKLQSRKERGVLSGSGDNR